jgi:multiple sugar transport system substrate-binding protein
MRASHFLQLIIALLVAGLLLVRLPRRKLAVSDDLRSSPVSRLKGATEAAATIELTYSVWGMPWEDLLFESYYAREFERRHPGVKIRYLRYSGGELVNKYNAWHVRGMGADVMRQHLAYYDKMVEQGINAPLDDYVKRDLRDEDIKDFVPQVWQRLKVKGHLYAVPEDLNQLGLFYNKDIFDAYNRTHPNDPIPYPDGSWTWEDLRRYADKLTIRKGKRIDVYGFDFSPGAGLFYAFLFQAGGRVWNEDKTRTLVNSPEGVEVLHFWRTLVRGLHIARPTEMRDSAVGPDKFFEFGRTAMFIDGTWRIPDVKNQAPHLRFGVAPLPRHRHRATVGGSCLWAISAHSPHKDLAWEFIKFLISKESNEKYWDVLWVAPPARLSAVFANSFRDTGGITDQGKVLIPPLKREEFEEKAAWMLENLRQGCVHIDQYGLYSPDLNRHLDIAIQKVMLPGSKVSPQEALDQCVKEVHQTIDRERRLKGLSP